MKVWVAIALMSIILSSCIVPSIQEKEAVSVSDWYPLNYTYVNETKQSSQWDAIDSSIYVEMRDYSNKFLFNYSNKTHLSQSEKLRILSGIPKEEREQFEDYYIVTHIEKLKKALPDSVAGEYIDYAYAQRGRTNAEDCLLLYYVWGGVGWMFADIELGMRCVD